MNRRIEVWNNHTSRNDSLALSRMSAALLSPLDLNSANEFELQRLEGIGPALAGRILDYRKENGDFKDVSDLEKIKGIGPVLITKIHDKITVHPAPNPK